MNLSPFLRYEIAFYWPWWVCFAGIAFCSARWLGGLGLPISALAISVLIIFIEVHSVFHDMREHPEWGRDADFVFWFGAVCRLVIYNLVSMLVGIFGWKLRARHHPVAHESPIR
jgi:hypothetical protein